MVTYLVRDLAMTAGRVGALHPALDRRLDAFAGRIAEARRGGVDEVLVVGHSSGAALAVTAAVRALAEGCGAPLAVVSLGQSMPMILALPGASALRSDLATLADAPEIAWLDVTAPGDPCSFWLTDPVAAAGLRPRARRPLAVSAAFTDRLAPARRRAMRLRFFRRHLQYLCAYDAPGPVDYVHITAGPRSLASRCAALAPSPSLKRRSVRGRR